MVATWSNVQVRGVTVGVSKLGCQCMCCPCVLCFRTTVQVHTGAACVFYFFYPIFTVRFQFWHTALAEVTVFRVSFVGHAPAGARAPARSRVCRRGDQEQNESRVGLYTVVPVCL